MTRIFSTKRYILKALVIVFLISMAISAIPPMQASSQAGIPTMNNLSTEEVLSAREFEVLELLMHGCKDREIALALEIEEVTVRFHVGNILDKLGVKNRTEAVCCAFRKGWIKD